MSLPPSTDKYYIQATYSFSIDVCIPKKYGNLDKYDYALKYGTLRIFEKNTDNLLYKSPTHYCDYDMKWPGQIEILPDNDIIFEREDESDDENPSLPEPEQHICSECGSNPDMRCKSCDNYPYQICDYCGEVPDEEYVGCCRDGMCTEVGNLCLKCGTWDEKTEQWYCQECAESLLHN